MSLYSNNIVVNKIILLFISIIYGLIDSIKSICIIFYLDKYIINIYKYIIIIHLISIIIILIVNNLIIYFFSKYTFLYMILYIFWSIPIYCIGYLFNLFFIDEMLSLYILNNNIKIKYKNIKLIIKIYHGICFFFYIFNT